MDTETTVKRFIEENFLHKRNIKSISRGESLLDTGLIDSIDIFELVTFIETQFNIQVLDEEVIPEHFETINNIVTFINTKRRSEAV